MEPITTGPSQFHSLGWSSLQPECLNLIALNLISDPDSLFVLSTRTCKKFQLLATDQKLWALLFKSYLPSAQNSEKEITAESFQRQLQERVEKLKEYLISLNLADIKPILEEIETKKSPF